MTATTIHVGASAPQFHGFADFFDGRTAKIQRAEIGISAFATGPALVISLPEGGRHDWPLADIRRVPDQAGSDTLLLSSKNSAVARLLVSDTESQRILLARCPDLNRRPPAKGRGRLVMWSLGAITSVAVILFLLVPVMANQLAEYLPPAGEKALGDTTFNQIRTALAGNDLLPVEICERPDGLAALDRMQTRLSQGVTLPYELSVHVLDHEMVNAFALPGGQIILFRGLLEKAESPDEVAAVFAHEMGHVVHRDPTRSALRTAGSIGILGLVLGDFAGGGAVLFMVERLIEASYSKDAEAAADAFAHALLADAGMSPSALAEFFERLRDEYGDNEGIVAHLAAHPSLTARIEAALTADEQIAGPIRPALGEVDWQDLRAICD